MALSLGHLEVDGQTERVDDEVDLRRRPTTRTPDRVALRPPFPPAECWCARLIVASMLCHSSSTSVRSAWNSRAQRPCFDQRSKRLNTVFQEPNSSGRSRHGTPVRRHHSTASIKLRLSFGGRPVTYSVSRTAAIRAHCSSVSCCRTIAAFRWNTHRVAWKWLLVRAALSAVHRMPPADFRDRP